MPSKAVPISTTLNPALETRLAVTRVLCRGADLLAVTPRALCHVDSCMGALRPIVEVDDLPKGWREAVLPGIGQSFAWQGRSLLPALLSNLGAMPSVSRWTERNPLTGRPGSGCWPLYALLMSDAEQTMAPNPSATWSSVGRSYSEPTPAAVPLLPMPFGVCSGCPRYRLASVEDRSP